jgi:hypothetical protein
MRTIATALSFALLGTTAVFAAPLNPRIVGHDFAFGAQEPSSVPFYDPRGDDTDYLTLEAGRADQEVVAFWEVWPVGGSPLPVFNAADELGGDLELYLEFEGEDADPPWLDVSITGAGRNTGADLIITGKMPDLGITDYELLVAIEIDMASLYGYGEQSSFVLETKGTFVDVNPLLPGAADILGKEAVSRGNIDFVSLVLPALYNPLTDYGLSGDGGAYSGEVGRAPEPASLGALLLGVVVLLRQRRAY